MDDSECLNHVSASRTPDRQILERVLRTVDCVEPNVSAAGDDMTALNTQMTLLQERMSSAAAFLAEQIRLVQEGQLDTTALPAAAVRAQATAEVVAGLDQPSSWQASTS